MLDYDAVVYGDQRRPSATPQNGGPFDGTLVRTVLRSKPVSVLIAAAATPEILNDPRVVAGLHAVYGDAVVQGGLKHVMQKILRGVLDLTFADEDTFVSVGNRLYESHARADQLIRDRIGGRLGRDYGPFRADEAVSTLDPQVNRLILGKLMKYAVGWASRLLLPTDLTSNQVTEITTQVYREFGLFTRRTDPARNAEVGAFPAGDWSDSSFSSLMDDVDMSRYYVRDEAVAVVESALLQVPADIATLVAGIVAESGGLKGYEKLKLSGNVELDRFPALVQQLRSRIEGQEPSANYWSAFLAHRS